MNQVPVIYQLIKAHCRDQIDHQTSGKNQKRDIDLRHHVYEPVEVVLYTGPQSCTRRSSLPRLAHPVGPHSVYDRDRDHSRKEGPADHDQLRLVKGPSPQLSVFPVIPCRLDAPNLHD